MAGVVIVGGGVMGMAAAYQAALADHDVTLIEGNGELGGMAAHFDFEGLSIERFYHFICKTDHDTFQLLDDLNLTDRLQWVDTSMGYFIEDHLHSWGDPWALLKFPAVGLMSRLRYGAHMFLEN